MDNKKGFLKGALTGALAMLVITAAIGAGVIVINHIDLGSMKKSGSGQVVGQYTEKKLEELKGLIDEVYLHEEEVDEEALTEGIYQGYIAALNDPYSAYYTAEETKEMMESTSGEYSGIGALMSQNRETGVITIANVYVFCILYCRRNERDDGIYFGGVQRNRSPYVAESRDRSNYDCQCL